MDGEVNGVIELVGGWRKGVAEWKDELLDWKGMYVRVGW